MPKKVKRVKRRVKPAAETRLELARFIKLLNKGQTREEIIETMGLNTNQFEALFGRYYNESEEEQQNKTPLRIFAEMVGRKQQLIRDLEDLKDFLKNKEYKNAQGFVAAVKTQSDMMNELVKLGQDLGLIIKTPEQLLLIGDRDVREMDHEELEQGIFKEMSDIRGMVAKRGTNMNKNAGKVLTFPGLAEQRESQT